MRENGIEESIDRPLTIALVVDTVGNQGNGTSNSALQWAAELERQGHHVRLVGIGAPEYPARVNKVPLVSWVAAKQLMQFAEPSDTLFRTAFQGVDVVHSYMPFKFGRRAAKVAHQMGIPVTAGFHLQPENVLYSAGPLRRIPGISSFLYWLFKHWLYKHIDHIHVPTEMTASLLRAHGYKAKLHVISNGYSPVYSPKKPADPDASAPVPFRVIASGRLASEKDQITLIKAVSMSRHAGDIQLVLAGAGALRPWLSFRAGRWGVRIGAGDRRVRTVGGQPVRADRRVVVPRARRGPAGPTHRLVDRTSGRARRMGREIRRIHQGALFRGSLGPQVRGYGTQGDRGIGAFSFAERSFPQSACGGQLPHQRDLRKNLPLMREVASRSDDGGRD